MAVSLLLNCCDPSSEPQADHDTLEFSFVINAPVRETIDPLPYPTSAIWLLDSAGNYVTSLMVSQWLGSEGYLEPEICPAWSQTSGWPEGLSRAQIDAVTSPTPSAYGTPHVFTFNCAEMGIAPGTYIYNLEVSVETGYNILAWGEIETGGAAAESHASIAYAPDVHPDAGEALSHVTVKYSP